MTPISFVFPFMNPPEFGVPYVAQCFVNWELAFLRGVLALRASLDHPPGVQFSPMDIAYRRFRLSR